VSEKYLCFHVKIREGDFVILNLQHVRNFFFWYKQQLQSGAMFAIESDPCPEFPLVIPNRTLELSYYGDTLADYILAGGWPEKERIGSRSSPVYLSWIDSAGHRYCCSPGLVVCAACYSA